MVKRRDKALLTTQCYIKGHPDNETDSIWKSVQNPRQRAAITVPFTPLRGAKAGELAAKFDLVLGVTPDL
jgi:protocatechuate 3,4-dioxygenase beta subunit